MKNTLLCATFITLFAMAAMAQDVSAPSPVRFDHTIPSVIAPFHPNPTTNHPNTLFYAGDPNCEDPNSQAFANGNTLTVPDTETLGAVTIPAGKHVLVEGLFINTVATVDEFDPATATWEIRTGVSEGNGGRQIASGVGPISWTGLNTCGLAVYASQVTVMLTQPQTLSEGTYWFNVTPQCTNSEDSYCDSQQFYVDNTPQGANNVRGHLQPLHQIYFNSAYFGHAYANWCDPSFGQNSHECAALSFGILGR